MKQSASTSPERVSRVKQFIENSPNVKTLKLCDDYINDTSINAFIKRAELKLKIRSKFFGYISSKRNKIQVSLNLTV